MRKTRIYQPGTYDVGETLCLHARASHHVAVVLRARVGDTLVLFPGNQREFQARITAVRKQAITVLVEESLVNHTESELQLHLGQAICKGDKMDWILQKATELGVQTITPIDAERGMVDTKRCEKKMAHWEHVLIHATEQCGRAVLPVLHPPRVLDAFTASIKEGGKWILCPHAGTSLHDIAKPQSPMTILVGPEGGWSPMELDTAKAAGFHAVTLGPRILRTETAPLAMIAVLQFMVGDYLRSTS